ncbi:hypothetical protein LNP17_19515 [Klebsiella variicola subsp. variicola]|nr:hypothetical protein [Klebsiella variicola subsp. variicola]
MSPSSILLKIFSSAPISGMPNAKMTCVEKILFDHFATPKSCHRDLPLSLPSLNKTTGLTIPTAVGYG